LLTNNFEVDFEFVDTGPNPVTVSDGGFAFWYVYEDAAQAQLNISKEHLHSQDHVTANLWMSAMRTSGFRLLGYRSQFDGLGIIFSNNRTIDEDGTKGANPVITCIVNEGIRPYSLWRGIPTADAKKINYRDGKEMKVNVRVEPTGVKIKFNGGDEMSIQKPMKSGGYIGFTTYTGNKGDPSPQEKSDFIVMKKIDTKNHDGSSKGENVPTVAPTEKPAAPAEKEDILHETAAFRDHRGESDAIKALTDMVFKLVVESQPLQTQMTTAVKALEKRLSVMEKSFEALKAELNKNSGKNLDAEFDAMKKELLTLSQYASTETKARNAKLESLHKDMAHVHKSSTIFGPGHIDKHLSALEESNQKTIETLQSGSRNMFMVSLIAIIFIVIAGLALYQKFRSWEHKHIL
jgi:ribosomal protein L29